MRLFACLIIVSFLYSAPTYADPLGLIRTEINHFYRPINQGANDQTVWHTGREVFHGDCDDYATAVASRLAQEGIHWKIYQVEARLRAAGKVHRIPHVVTCAQIPDGETCMGSYEKRWFPQGKVHKKWKLLAQSVD